MWPEILRRNQLPPTLCSSPNHTAPDAACFASFPDPEKVGWRRAVAREMEKLSAMAEDGSWARAGPGRSATVRRARRVCPVRNAGRDEPSPKGRARLRIDPCGMWRVGVVFTLIHDSNGKSERRFYFMFGIHLQRAESW